jgi:hypothetical protein
VTGGPRRFYNLDIFTRATCATNRIACRVHGRAKMSPVGAVA